MAAVLSHVVRTCIKVRPSLSDVLRHTEDEAHRCGIEKDVRNDERVQHAAKSKPHL